MSRRDKPRKKGRRAPFRNPKPLVLIVCEGENTEPGYLRDFVRLSRNPRVEIEVIGKSGSPKTVVRAAKAMRESRADSAKRERDENLAYDAAWCVFDRDDWTDVPDAFQMARDNELRVAFSNPCFDLWLLLHLRDSPGMKHRDEVSSLFAELCTSYDPVRKTVDVEELIVGYAQAVRRAERMCQSIDERQPWERNPYTDVHLLTAWITEESGPEEV